MKLIFYLNYNKLIIKFKDLRSQVKLDENYI